MKVFFPTLACCVVFLLVMTDAVGDKLQEQSGKVPGAVMKFPTYGSTNPDVQMRRKREIYVTFQDRAQSLCIGLCMYHEKKTFFKCQRKCRIGVPKSREIENDAV